MRKVRPGLYARLDTPQHVPISAAFMAAIRVESPWLADWLEAAERDELRRRLDAEQAKSWWDKLRGK